MKRHTIIKQGYLDFCVACGASRPHREKPWSLNEERQPWCPGLFRQGRGRLVMASDAELLAAFKTWLVKTNAVGSLKLLVAALEELEIPDRNDVWGSEGPDN